MAISVRSPLLACTVASVAAASITAGGVIAADSHRLPASISSVADVQLAAFASPLLEIYDTIQKTNLYLFSIAEPPATQFDRAGLIPDFLAAGFPIATQYFLNAPDYVSVSLNYLFQDFVPPGPTPYVTPYPGALRILTWAVDALPANIGYAAQQVFSGNLVGALQTLQFAIGNPAQAALYQTLNAGLYVLGGVADRVAAVATEIASWVPTTIRNIADDVTVVMNAAANVVSNVVYGIQTLSLQTVWNALVVGLLGTDPNPATPTIPDALINQTIGEGGRIYTSQPNFVEVPSFRQNQIELRDAIADALATAVPIPEDPPYPVSFFPYQSQIPTPWNPTPGPTPVAAAAASLSSEDPIATVAGPSPTATSGSELQRVPTRGNAGETVRNIARPANTSHGSSDRRGAAADSQSKKAGARSAHR